MHPLELPAGAAPGGGQTTHVARTAPLHGAAMRTLLAGLTLVDVPDPDDAAADADTWSDVERLDAEMTAERIDP